VGYAVHGMGRTPRGRNRRGVFCVSACCRAWGVLSAILSMIANSTPEITRVKWMLIFHNDRLVAGGPTTHRKQLAPPGLLSSVADVDETTLSSFDGRDGDNRSDHLDLEAGRSRPCPSSPDGLRGPRGGRFLDTKVLHSH